MRIVLMGMPGVGKGTQATALREHLGVPHVSTGDILREAVRAASPLGRRVKAVLESGELVPDGLMQELIVNRLGQADAGEGFILDGFPRTQEQVAILDRVLQKLGSNLDGVYLLAAEDEEIVRRLGGRRVCPKCTAVYHLETRVPASPGVCDACGSALVQRPDDTESVIRDRLRVYAEQTWPIVETYRNRGLLREIDASGSPETVAGRLKQAVGQP
jgi:adenylate kinase